MLEENEYEKKVKEDGDTKVAACDTRLSSFIAMKNTATNLVCKDCAIENREKNIVSYVVI